MKKQEEHYKVKKLKLKTKLAENKKRYKRKVAEYSDYVS